MLQCAVAVIKLTKLACGLLIICRLCKSCYNYDFVSVLQINPPYMCLQNKGEGYYSCPDRYDEGNKWYYDYKNSTCEEFYYYGCGGNTNRFDTEFECESSCTPRR